MFSTLLQRKIRCYWWHNDLLRGPNAGDVAAVTLLSAFSGRIPVKSKNGLFRFFTVGSVLHKVKFGDILWGTGSRYDDDKKLPRHLRVHAVRGPLTAQVLKKQGIFVPEIYGDPGIFIPGILGITASQKVKIGIVPHFKDFPAVEKKITDPAIKIIDILSGLKNVIEEISTCSLIYSSSLHGIVFAEAMGIPSMYVQFEKDPDTLRKEGRSKYKFDDYYLGTERDPVSPLDWSERIHTREPIVAAPIFNFDGLLRSCPFNYREITELKQLYLAPDL